MADAVTSQTIQDGERTAVLRFTNVSDGTGESAVKKVDVSALGSNARGQACTTGDLDFTTVGHSSGDSYMIILELIKKYD